MQILYKFYAFYKDPAFCVLFSFCVCWFLFSFVVFNRIGMMYVHCACVSCGYNHEYVPIMYSFLQVHVLQ
jgi:hypothetical protein